MAVRAGGLSADGFGAKGLRQFRHLISGSGAKGLRQFRHLSRRDVSCPIRSYTHWRNKYFRLRHLKYFGT